MYLVLSCDSNPPRDIVKSGSYNNNNCGGECEWFITSTIPENSDDYIGVCSYTNELYFCLFE